MDPYQVIIRPHTSEKSHEYIESDNTYVFRVTMDATKTDIRAAVEKVWDVKIKSIRTINMHGKRKRFGRTVGHTGPWKKALVRLHEGEAIEALR